ncbi:adenylosuccinate lyase [Telmatospirillum siberiense]|uniref:Adenylosuccinate lyase n=1 Tax=Telmatospirillum siberiense TaxID=382514 RepID=A0A2N3Q188_9PROT|nr:adenylosuccinate lyase [Telmatospirillum siberiense]PKU26413.1 adenylosuccinate lyase [Telmatospirillum siberiense]
MIPRYSRPDMARIWEPENKFRIWFEIEAHACDAQAKLGVIPASAAKAVWEKGNKPYTAERVAHIDEIEKVTKHDVIAFTTELAEHVGPEARFIHQGMTSSDVLDTCLAVQLTQAADLLLSDIDGLLAALERRAFETRDVACMGRSHGIHAEPVTIGLKFAGFHAEFQRNRERLAAARKDIATCAISGAVGTFANIDPFVESHVAEKLGLTPEPLSTQIIPRDRHAMFFATLGVIASSMERVATEIRHLQRTEVREVEEYFSPGQKGSSAMPHKRNPVLTENITGLARLVRGMVTPALENVALWHERDISHSSVERMIGPDATVTLDFALARLTNVVANLVIYPDAILRNLNQLGGLIFSQRVLLALTQAGMSREDAYKAVQRNAMQVWNGQGRFLDLLKSDDEVVSHLGSAAIEALFDLGYHTKHVGTIFQRVFGRQE